MWTGRVEAITQTNTRDRRTKRTVRVVNVSATDAVAQLNATPRYGVVGQAGGPFGAPMTKRATQLLASAPESVEWAEVPGHNTYQGFELADLVYESTLWNHLLLWFNSNRYPEPIDDAGQLGVRATMYVDRAGVFRVGDRSGRDVLAVTQGPRRFRITDHQRASEPLPAEAGPRIPALRAGTRLDTFSALNTVELQNHASQLNDAGELVALDETVGPFQDAEARANYGARTLRLETCFKDPAADGPKAAAGVFAAHAPDPFGRYRPRVESVTVSVTDVPPEHVPTLALVELEDGLFVRVGDTTCDNWPVSSIDHDITTDDWLITYGLTEDA